MKYCRSCDRYLDGCRHLDRRLTPRQPRWEVVTVYVLLFGTLAYVVGGVWGLW